MNRVLAALLFTAAIAVAQVDVTSVTGLVTDPTGAAVPGASVSVLNTATGAKLSATTSDRGEYAVPARWPVFTVEKSTVPEPGKIGTAVEEVRNRNVFVVIVHERERVLRSHVVIETRRVEVALVVAGGLVAGGQGVVIVGRLVILHGPVGTQGLHRGVSLGKGGIGGGGVGAGSGRCLVRGGKRQQVFAAQQPV